MIQNGPLTVAALSERKDRWRSICDARLEGRRCHTCKIHHDVGKRLAGDLIRDDAVDLLPVYEKQWRRHVVERHRYPGQRGRDFPVHQLELDALRRYCGTDCRAEES